MTIDIIALIGAFGGGVFGAAIGGTVAFIMTGFIALAAGIAAATGVLGADFAGTMAFGSLLGPHIAFAGGVAAAAYARKIGKMENGADCMSSLFGLAEPSVLVVGGVFGMIGYIIAAVVGFIFGGVLPVGTDNPGMTVFISGCIARLVFGQRGLLSDPSVRKPFSKGGVLGSTVVIGFAFPLAVSAVYIGLAKGVEAAGLDVATILGSYHIVVFGLAAVGLLLAAAGFAFPAWHHTGIIAAEAVMAGYAIGGATTGLILGVVMGFVATMLGDFAGNFINSDVDSHIDPPAFAIFISTIIISIINLVA